MIRRAMGIGDWAQSPIPNPQSPIPMNHAFNDLYQIYIYNNSNILSKYQADYIYSYINFNIY